MTPLRRIFIFLLSLTLAIAVLWAIPKTPLLFKSEHALFLHPETLTKKNKLTEHGTLTDFEIKVLETHQAQEQLALSTYILDSETQEILGSETTTPTQWAYLLSNIRKNKGDLITIATPLSWLDAQELPLRALDQEIAALAPLALNLKANNQNTGNPLPDYLQPSVIAELADHHLDLPKLDHILTPPSITSAFFGLTPEDDRTSADPGKTIQMQLLYRWDNHILPSLHLATFMVTHKLTPADIHLEHQGPTVHLRLGKTGAIIPLNQQGRATFTNTGTSSKSTLNFLTRKSPFQHSIILIDEATPTHLAQLSSHHADIWPQRSSISQTYTRWPVQIELALLVLFAITLQTRPFFHFTPVLFITLIAAHLTQHWLLLSPILILILARFIQTRLLPHLKKSR